MVSFSTLNPTIDVPMLPKNAANDKKVEPTKEESKKDDDVVDADFEEVKK